MKKLLAILFLSSGLVFGAIDTEVDENYLFENNGTAEVDSGNDLTSNGNITYGTTSPPEGTYYAEFDGTGDFYDDGDNANFEVGANDFTVSFWVYFTGSRWSIASKYVQYESGWEFTDTYDGGWVPAYMSGISWSETSVQYWGGTPTANTWYHVVLAFTVAAADELQVWVSNASTFGSEVNGDTFNVDDNPGANSADFRIGQSENGDMDGNIDDFVWALGYACDATDAEALWDGSWRSGTGAEVQVITTVTG